MSFEERKEYGEDIRLLNIEAEKPFDWGAGDATHIRVSLPASAENMLKMQQRGFFHADRMLDVSINLVRSKLDFKSMIRIAPRITSECRENVLSIAQNSFSADRRFNIGAMPNREISDKVIAGWISELSEYYLCEYKEEPIGFLALKQQDDKKAFIHLAAVLERYRASGAALSLYAAAANDCRERGFSQLNGRISSANTPVMNLYAFLGATFSNPTDVYLKEV